MGETGIGRVAILSSIGFVEGSLHELPPPIVPPGNLQYFRALLGMLTPQPRLADLAFEGDPAARARLLRELIAGAAGEYLIRYHVSREMPPAYSLGPDLGDVKDRVIDLLRELASMAGGRIRWEASDPREEAAREGRRGADRYLEALARGEQPPEPRPAMDLFQKESRASEAEVAAARRQKAEAKARKTGKPVELCHRELLEEDFAASDLDHLQVFRHVMEMVSSPPATMGKPSSRFFSAIEVVRAGEPHQPEVIQLVLHAEGLELEIARRVLKLSGTARPRLIYAGPPAGVMARSDPRIWLEQEFEFQEAPLTESAERRPSCIIVHGPEGLGVAEVQGLHRAIAAGIPAVILVSRWSVDLSEGGRGGACPIRAVDSRLDRLFARWGITLGKEALASRTCYPVPVGRFRPPGPRLPILLQTMASALEGKHPAHVSRVHLCFPAAVEIRVDAARARAAGLSVTVLADSGPTSYPVGPPPGKEGSWTAVRDVPEIAEGETRRGGYLAYRPLAVLLQGRFPPLTGPGRPKEMPA